jgi:hypothetical protein
MVASQCEIVTAARAYCPAATGLEDLLAVIKVLRPDEPDDGVHQQRLEPAGNGVRASLAGLLVHPMVSGRGEGAALPCLEVHDVGADGATPQLQRRVPRLCQQSEGNPEARVGSLGTRDGLEHEIHRRTPAHYLERGSHMGQYAGLSGDSVPLAQGVDHVKQCRHRLWTVAGRVDPDHRVP